MATDWIEAVMRINGAIIEAETRLNAEAINLVDTADRGQDTTKAETLLKKHQRELVLLRTLQAVLLQEGQDEV